MWVNIPYMDPMGVATMSLYQPQEIVAAFGLLRGRCSQGSREASTEPLCTEGRPGKLAIWGWLISMGKMPKKFWMIYIGVAPKIRKSSIHKIKYFFFRMWDSPKNFHRIPLSNHHLVVDARSRSRSEVMGVVFRLNCVAATARMWSLKWYIRYIRGT